MAQTTNTYQHAVDVVISDTSDWLWTAVQAEPLRPKRVVMSHCSAGDEIKIRNGTLTGPGPWLKSIGGEGVTLPLDGLPFEPCIYYNECTLTAGTVITFWLLDPI